MASPRNTSLKPLIELYRQLETADLRSNSREMSLTLFWGLLLESDTPDPQKKLRIASPAIHTPGRKISDQNLSLYRKRLLDAPELVGGIYETMQQEEKHRGVYYTPSPIAAYLVERSLGLALTEYARRIEVAVTENDGSQANSLLRQVQALRILDPACGCGIFLFHALQEFLGFYQTLESHLSGLSRLDAGFLETLRQGPTHALKHQLFGMDLDPLAVFLAEWSLATTFHNATGLDVDAPLPNLVVGNTLCRESGFPAVSNWDFILGNPPYMTEVREQKELFRFIREESRVRQHYYAKMDLCDAFLALGIDLLKPGGTLAYVLPEYWTQRASTRPLRETLWPQIKIRELWTFGNTPVFDRAPGHHTSLVILEKQPNSSAKNTILLGRGDVAPLEPDSLRPAGILWEAASGKILVGPADQACLLEKLGALTGKLLLTEEIQQGIVIPQGRLKAKDHSRLPRAVQEQVQPDSGIFLLNEVEITALNLSEAEKKLLKPYLPAPGFKAFSGVSGPFPETWILYGEDCSIKEAMARAPELYPSLKAHLDGFSKINTSAHAPYGLHRPRQPVWFEASDKILGLRQTLHPAFSRVTCPAYVTEGYYILRSQNHDPDLLCGLLNSTLAWFWFYHQKSKGERLQIDKDVLLSVPLPPRLERDADWVMALRNLARDLRTCPPSPADPRLRHLDALVYQGYALEHEEIQTVETARWGLEAEKWGEVLRPFLADALTMHS